MKTTYRIILETESRPRGPTLSLDHVASIQVDAPSVEVAARLALSTHIDTRPTPPPAGTSFSLVVITPPPPTPGTARHDLEPEAEICRMDVSYWPTAGTVH